MQRIREHTNASNYHIRTYNYLSNNPWQNEKLISVKPNGRIYYCQNFIKKDHPLPSRIEMVTLIDKYLKQV